MVGKVHFDTYSSTLKPFYNWISLYIYIYIYCISLYSYTSYLLCLTAAFNDEDVGINVLHTHPVWQRQSGVGPNPVHHCSQFHQERHQTKPTYMSTTLTSYCQNTICWFPFKGKNKHWTIWLWQDMKSNLIITWTLTLSLSCTIGKG